MEFLQKVLPWIGAAASGNVPGLVAMAATAVSDAFGHPVEASAEGIQAALTGASPQQIEVVRAADQEFALKMQALGFQHAEALAQMATADTANAREREVKTADSWTPRLLAGFAVVLFIALVVGVLMGIAPVETMKDTFLILVGAAIAVFKDVYGYYFGSSSGSADKNRLLAAGNR